VKELIDEGFLEVEGGRLKLGSKGLFVSNSVIGELLATF
jgi:coproporphyrinogen III oxidase-like Fe-S oxidoreductase